MTKEEKESKLLEERRIKALEKIAASLDALTLWFEEINKEEWDKRLQYYLSEFHEMAKTDSSNKEEQNVESKT